MPLFDARVESEGVSVEGRAAMVHSVEIGQWGAVKAGRSLLHAVVRMSVLLCLPLVLTSPH